MSQWRLTLDVPYAFSVENGYRLDKHCADFRVLPDSLSGTYREPVTGVVMLKPSFLSQGWVNNLTGLSGFRTTDNPGFWQQISRTIGIAPLMTSGVPAGQSPSGIAISAQPFLPILPGASDDTLVWGLETLSTLKQDEAFVLYQNACTDELQRHANWFAVQWDNILLHFNGNGVVHVYLYADRTQLTTPPTLIDQFQIASPTQLMQDTNYFWFQPIPGLGLLLQHANIPQGLFSTTSSANAYAVRGHLIPLQFTRLPDGSIAQFGASPLRVGLNPNWGYVFGFERVTFSGPGTYTDAAFDIGYEPSIGIFGQSPVVGLTEQQNVQMAVKDNAAAGAWVIGEQQGRCQFTLNTSDPTYTPFLFGYVVAWPPVFATRNTTPVLLTNTADGPDIANRLEFTRDEKGDFEGVVHATITSDAAIAIAARGDASFLLERTDDGSTWFTEDGGFAKDWKLKPIFYQGGDFAYEVTFTLLGMRERLRETYQNRAFALDGMTIANAINTILTCSGFAGVASFPPDALNTTLPQSENGTGWRFGGREGDHSDELLDLMLFLLRKENAEYLGIFDWDGGGWTVVPKPHDASAGATWILYGQKSLANASLKHWYVGPDWEIDPESPEANTVLAEGQVTPDPNSERIAIPPLINVPSVVNPSDPNYLGRYKTVKVSLPYITDETDLFGAAKLIFKAVKNNRQKAKRVPVPTAQMALLPNTHVQFATPSGGLLLDAWIKRVTTIVERDIDAHQLLDVDSIWDGEVPR